MPAFGPATPEMKPLIEADRRMIKDALKRFDIKYLLHFRCSNKHGHRFLLEIPYGGIAIDYKKGRRTTEVTRDMVQTELALIRGQLTYPIWDVGR
jgi:hypothetical protein